MTEPVKTLAEKIAAARAKIGSLKPDKQNLEQNYKYISADKILERGGDVLAEMGIAIIPSVIEAGLTTVERVGKSSRIDAVLKMQMMITDGGQKEYVAYWTGCGSDYAAPDKAIYKAITSGHKYFLMKLLNIGVGNEDGEHETEPGQTEQKQTTTQKNPAKVASIPEPPTPPETGQIGTPLRYQPVALRERIQQTATSFIDMPFNEKQIGLLAASFNACFNGDEDKRKAVLFFLTGEPSLNATSSGDNNALLKWLAPTKGADNKYHPDPMAVREANAALDFTWREQGQQELPQ